MHFWKGDQREFSAREQILRKSGEDWPTSHPKQAKLPTRQSTSAMDATAMHYVFQIPKLSPLAVACRSDWFAAQGLH